MTMQKLTYLLAVLFILSCNRDEVDPSDYADDGAIRPNQFTLKADTYILTEEDKQYIVGVDDMSILAQKDAAFLSGVKVGSVLVNTASDPGDTIAYFRKVIAINEVNNNIRLETKDAMLWEAYSRYIIDSRSNENIFIRTNLFSAVVECKPSNLGGWVGLTVGAVPDFNGTISFDADSTYFTAQYDSLGTIPFKMEMRLTNLVFDFSGSVLFKGTVTVGTPWKLVPAAIPVIVIGSTGLTLYVEPKAKFGFKVAGQIQSPTLTMTSGPHNFFFSYDESNLAQPEDYLIDPKLTVDVKETMDWSATGKGNAELQAGTDIFLGITGAPKLVKAGFNVFGYVTANAAQKGNFTDLQPRVSFDADLGIGGKGFAEIGFLVDSTSLINPGNWLGITSKIETPEVRARFTTWHIGDMETCDQYNSVIMFLDNFQNTNEILLTVDCPGCGNNGYYVWVNDIPIDNGATFPYDQSAVITLPPGLELLNTIAIQDKSNFGCYLSDNFLDPDLFNANCTKFVDARDGNSYCSVLIGEQTWMGENLRYSSNGDIGHWYLNEEGADTLLFGRLYDLTEVLNGEEPNAPGEDDRIQGLCPDGWHLPSQTEWRTLRDYLGGGSRAGKNIKINSSAIWPGTQDLPSSSLFNAVSAGEYYPWLEGDSTAVSGNQYKHTTFWTNERANFINNTVRPIIVIVDDSNALNIGAAATSQSAGLFGYSSIEQIGYSCRCVKD